MFLFAVVQHSPLAFDFPRDYVCQVYIAINTLNTERFHPAKYTKYLMSSLNYVRITARFSYNIETFSSDYGLIKWIIVIRFACCHRCLMVFDALTIYKIEQKFPEFKHVTRGRGIPREEHKNIFESFISRLKRIPASSHFFLFPFYLAAVALVCASHQLAYQSLRIRPRNHDLKITLFSLRDKLFNLRHARSEIIR